MLSAGIEAAKQKGDLFVVGQVVTFKNDIYSNYIDFDRRLDLPENQLVERIKQLDVISLVSLGFEIAENWAEDEIHNFPLLRANQENQVYPEDYAFSMIPVNSPYIGDSDKALADKAELITTETLERADSASDIPMTYIHTDLAWRFKATRNGETKEYRCIVSLLHK